VTEQIKNRIAEIKQGKVPDGYIRNSLGVTPEAWEEKTLNDIGCFYKGKGIPGNELQDDGLPCIGYGDIYMKYNYHFEKALNFVNQKTADESQPIQKGTLLFTGSGETAEEIGKCVCYNGDEIIYAGGDIILYNTDVNPLLISYQQSIEPSIKAKTKLAQGHSVVHIYADRLGKLSVVYPQDKQEQKKITDVLMKWDEAIALQEKLIEKLEVQKKALMQRLLTPKEDWANFLMASLGETYGGLVNKSKDDFGEGKPYVTYMNIFSNSILDVNSFEYVRINAEEKQNKVKYGDILFTTSSETPEELGATSVLLSEIDELYLNSFCFGFKLFNFYTLTPEFAAYFFRSLYFRTILKSLAQGATRFNLSKSSLMKVDIFLPDIEIQKKIAAILTKADNIIAFQQQKLNNLKLQQKSLMQLLLTGIVRV